jgi:hypothetical protein
MDIFPDANLVRDIQKELDEIIQIGVFQITKLLQNSESALNDDDVRKKSKTKCELNYKFLFLIKILLITFSL